MLNLFECLLLFLFQSRYEFSHILTDKVSQSAAFKELAIPLLDDLIQGKNSAYFFYEINLFYMK